MSGESSAGKRQYQTILVETSDGVTTVTLNRPEKRNAMSPQLHHEMSRALEELAEDVATKVLVITGAGDSFCAGMDLNEVFYAHRDDAAGRRRVLKDAEWRSHALRLFPKPTIAMVNGWCFGGAFTIVASCDIAIGADDATFGLSEVNFGKIAGGYVSKAISGILNPRDSRYYVLTGEPFDGRRAEAMHLLTRSVPRADLARTVAEVAEGLARKNPHVVRAAKEALVMVEGMDWDQAGAWLSARGLALDHEGGTAWQAGIEQFQRKTYRPGLGQADWQSSMTASAEVEGGE
jgi:trans-feruloyl-CoA hydratase/vanillin synthase